MEHISIFNYEAFYLDFLEGNLNEEDTLLLLNFLEQHPELKVDNDTFALLETNDPILSEEFKAGLKQISFNDTRITTANVEQFMIAETEGLLSSQKQNELSLFIGSTQTYIKDRKLFAASHLRPDLSIFYDNKGDLKKRKTIALWPIISFAAAASIAAFFFIVQPSSEPNVVSGIEKEIQDKDSSVIQIKSNENKEQIREKSAPNTSTAHATSETIQLTVLNSQTTPKVPKNIDPLKVRKVNKINSIAADQELVPNRSTTNHSNISFANQTKDPSDYASLGFQDMKNPIKPITNRLSDIVEQEVDFRTAKTSDRNSGGFYLKIGKLEISHKKH